MVVGSFEIFAISADTFGHVNLFDASFVQHCESSTAPPLVGAVKYQALPSTPLTVTSSNPSSVLYQPVTLSAHVASPNGGMVSFLDGGTMLGMTDVDAKGVGTLTLSSLSVGTHSVTAAYSGYTSAPVVQTVRDNTVSLWFSSESGDWLGKGATESYAQPGDNVAFGGTLSGASVSVSGGGESWTVRIGPPPGQAFAVGDYAGATRFPTGNQPGISIVGDGRGCNNDFGEFVVTNVQSDVSGNLTALDATFTQSCESPTAPEFYGSIHYFGGNAPPPPPPTSTSTTTTTTVPPPASPVTIGVSRLDFGGQRVGTYGDPQVVWISNFGNTSVSVTRLSSGGSNPYDFFGGTDCSSHGHPRVLAPGGECQVVVFFSPLQRGSRTASLIVTDNSGSAPQSVALSGTGTEGYFIADSRGEIGTFGDAVFHGDARRIHLKSPVISLATTPNGAGYWLLGRDGGIFSYGNARFYGSTGAMRLNKPIVAMSATRDGRGYRLVGSDGGIFAFGDARFYGSTGNIRLNKPIDGMAATVDDRGYWLVASDGGIFAFGNARFYGSAANAHLSSPVIQMTPTPSGKGYWILTGDGHLYAYGDAHSYGSAVGQHTIGMAATPDGRGYWEVTRDGRIFNFGNAAAYGDIRNQGVNDVIGIAATAPALPPGLLGVAIATSKPGAATRSVSGLDPISTRDALAPERALSP